MAEVGAGLVFIHPGHDIGSTRHADRRGVVVFVKDHPVFAKFVHIGSLDLRVTVATDGESVLVVRKEENNVWFLRVHLERSE